MSECHVLPNLISQGSSIDSWFCANQSFVINIITISYRMQARLWKDHFKNDLRSDQDHRQKIDLRSRSRFLKIEFRSRSRS
jgi:hypothetical protein